MPVAVVLCATAVVCVAMGWPAAPLAPAILALVVVALLIASIREWIAVVRGRKPATVKEAAYVETAYA